MGVPMHIIYMGSFFDRVCQCVWTKKWALILLVILSLVMIGLAVYSASRFEGLEIEINLTNIAIIRFLMGGIGIVATIFLTTLACVVFFFLILLCHCKTWLIPLGWAIYLYYVYCQAVVIVSLIIKYGFLNCVLVVSMLIMFLLVSMAIFLLAILDFLSICRCSTYFSTCFNIRDDNTLIYLIALVVFISLFVLVLSIMKSFMILLIY